MTPNEGPLLEICVDSVSGALTALSGGADRVELCSALLLGGLTPSMGMVRIVRERVKHLDLMVMVRPRGGDFLYDATEIQTMERDIDVAKESGADGVVFGLLTEEGAIDVANTSRLLRRAHPLSVTFHRAFDHSRDLEESLRSLVDLGIPRVLTSGGEADVGRGMSTLRRLVEIGNDAISIMPGGGISEENVGLVLKHTGAREVHASASETLPAKGERGCSLGPGSVPGEFDRRFTSLDRVRRIRAAAGNTSSAAP